MNYTTIAEYMIGEFRYLAKNHELVKQIYPTGAYFSKTRERDIVLVRQVTHALFQDYKHKYLEDITLGEIGKLIGSGDHATVLHSKKKTLQFLETEPIYKRFYIECENIFHRYFNESPTILDNSDIEKIELHMEKINEHMKDIMTVINTSK